MDGENIERYGGTFAVFALPSFPGNFISEADIDENGNQVRRRRKHIKSRAGCASCKERKIKCDEKRPSCKNCMNRQSPCSYPTPVSRNGSQSSLSWNSESPPKGMEESSSSDTRNTEHGCATSFHLGSEGVDMQPMELLHQFETYTSETMMFGAKVWRLRVLPLALKNSYLMHAILLIACSHLRYQYPDEPAYRRLEAQHLSLTLTDFRKLLGEPMSGVNIDVLAACGLALLHHAWSVTDSLEDMDIGGDNLFALSAGPRSVIEQMLAIRHQSVFDDVLCPDYAGRLSKWVDSFNATYELEGLFTCRAKEGSEYLHADTIQHFIPILRVYELQLLGVDLSDVRIHYYVSRYLFNWPAKCSVAFLAQVQSKDPEALLILLCFYTITPRLLSTAWWVHNRSIYMRRIICKMFRDQSREWNEKLKVICKFFDRVSGDSRWSWSERDSSLRGDSSQLSSDVDAEMAIFS